MNLILIILFFISLAGIAFMIGRKLFLKKNGKTLPNEKFSVKIPELREIKQIAVVHAKKYGYVALVETIRFGVKSSNFLKQQSAELTEKIKKILNKNKPENSTEPKEVSSFLKMISEYKQKIKKIKHKIKEEEGIK